MKCVKNLITGEIKRVRDEVASKLIDREIVLYTNGMINTYPDDWWIYIPKREWKVVRMFAGERDFIEQVCGQWVPPGKRD